MSEAKYIKQKNFYELDDKLKLQILIKMFTDAGYDLTKWYFNLSVTEKQTTLKELEDACKTAIEMEDFEKACVIRDAIKRKRENIN